MERFEPTGELRLRFKRKQSGKTYMAGQYYALPLQVLPPYYPDEDGEAFVYLLNPSGGILQADRLLTQIVLEKDSRVLVTTPSAAKFYKMEDDHAELKYFFDVGENAVLEYLPEYSIPYAGSAVYQESRFDIRQSSVLIAADMITAGRADRGERFQYECYDSRIKIYVEGKLQAYEYARLLPAEGKLGQIGLLEGRQIYAAMYIYQKSLPAAFSAEVKGILDSPGQEQLKGGVSYVTPDLAVVRLLANSVETAQETVLSVWGAARRRLLGKERVKIRK